MRRAPVRTRDRTSRSRSRSRPRPQLEWLESRLLLDAGLITEIAGQASNLAILSVDPPSGSVLRSAPATVAVQFNRALDPFSLGSDNDFDLLQLGPDGTFTSIYYNVNPSPSESLDPSGKTLTLSLNRQLGAGQYQVVLRGSSALAARGGSLVDRTGLDQIITEFTVAPPGVTLAGALNLGPIGSTPSTTTGALDLASNPAAVSLYKITLPIGHFWRLGLEVTAQRDGESLDSSLALFDAKGHVIATDDLGRPDDPLDPYLFAGVPPGTYYVGVSGAGNLPGAPGGYDPTTGTPGSAPQNQGGGTFHLHLVADPADAPATLLGFAVDHADPISAVPTGFTLQFSEPIRLNAPIGGLGNVLAQGITVIDAAGHAWPLVASSYHEAQAEVSYLFENPLPAGSYTVQIPSQNGLTDLAGLTPVAAGLPSGVLATFSVPAQADAGHRPGDMGPLFPSLAQQGVVLAATLGPGQSQTFRFVAEYPGIYTFQSQYSGGSLAIVRDGPGGRATLDAGLPGQSNGTNDAELVPGVYEITLADTGNRPATAQLTLRAASVSLESILENGLGQGPALSLRLVVPSDLGLSASSGLNAVPVPSASPSDPITTSAAPSTGSTVSPGLFVFLAAGSLIGRPVTEPTGLLLASAPQDVASDAPDTTAIVLSQGASTGLGWQALSFFRPQSTVKIALRQPHLAVAMPELSMAMLPASEAPALQAISLSLPKFAWFDRLRPALANWFRVQGPEPLPSREARASLPLLPAADLASPAQPATETGSSRVIKFAPPVGIALAAGILLQNRRTIYRWISPRKRRAATWRMTSG